MYVVGGFDGSRLNDMYHIAVFKHSEDSDDCVSVTSSMRANRQSSTGASGIMQNVPSDLSVHNMQHDS